MSSQINVNEFKNGMTFLKDNNIYIVLESSHSKSGRGQAHVKVKAKNLLNNSIINITFVGGERVEKAYIEKKNMQFLYFDEKYGYFMDLENYEQIEISIDKIKSEQKFLKEELEVIIKIYNNQILGIELPKNITYTVTETSDAVKGDTVSGATKKAIIETGLEIDVPQFININDKIVLNIESKKYISKG